MWAKLFVVWISLLPFIFWTRMFEGAKIFWFWLGGFFLTAFWLLKLKTKLPKVVNKADFWYFSWLAVLLISSIFGVHPADSIIGGSYRHQGVLFFFTLWLVGKTVSILPNKYREFLIKAIATVVIVESLVVVLQSPFDTLFGFPMTVNGRPLGTLGEPNAAAGFLAIGSVFLLKFTSLLLVFLAVLATQSRTGMLSFLIVALGLFVINRKKIISWSMKEKILAGLSILVIFVVSGFVIRGTFLTRPASVFEDRGVYLRLGWKAIMDKPFLGFGAESGEAVYDMAYATANLPLYELIIDRSHNLFFDIAIWSGFLGLFLFLGWLVAAANNLVKQGKWINVVGGLGWIAFSMLQPLGVVHWVLLVVILNLGKQSRTTSSGTSFNDILPALKSGVSSTAKLYGFVVKEDDISAFNSSPD